MEAKNMDNTHSYPSGHIVMVVILILFQKNRLLCLKKGGGRGITA